MTVINSIIYKQVYIFLQSPRVTARQGKIQVLDKLPGGQQEKSDATMQVDTLLQSFLAHVDSTSSTEHLLFTTGTVKKLMM